MQNHAWAALLRHIPPEQQSQYMLVTRGGTEIAVQSLLRLEDEFAVVKGRLAGSQDAGRVFFVPYENIDYFGTQQPVKDADFNEVFNSLVLPGATPFLPETPVPPAPPRPDSGPRAAIRSEILERYRARPSSASILPDPKGNGR